MILNDLTITSIATLVSSIGALIYAIRGDNNSRRNTTKIEEVKEATHGLKTELVEGVRGVAVTRDDKS